MNKKFTLVNLGCKVNAVEIEQISEQLVREGFSPGSEAEAEVALVNTCTVTARADQKSLYTMRRLSRLPKLKYLFVTGCYSELERDLDKKISAITKVIPQNKKSEAAEIIRQTVEASNEAESEENLGPDALFRHHILYKDSKNSPAGLANEQTVFFDHARAFVKVQDGCNNFCTFCRIPFARGAPVSRSLEDILAQIRELGAKGFSEVVLTGINMGVYRHQGIGFAELFKKILENAGAVMIRVSSVEPQSLEDAFVEALSHPNATPHIHLPLQGGTDSLLERMNRLYSTEEFLSLVRRIQTAKPDFAISTDVISGFPGETEAEHAESLRFAEACGFMKIHVFPYSRRPLSKAYDFPDQVDEKTRKRRVGEWKALSDRLHASYASHMEGKTQRLVLETLLEDDGHQTFEGTSDYYLKGKVRIPKNMNFKRGQQVAVRLADAESLRFEIAV